MIQIVHLSKGQILTKYEVQRKLADARISFQNFKVTFSNKTYLNINFNRDYSIAISTNSRNLSLYTEIQAITHAYTQMRLVDFVFRWIQNLTKG